jgi:hypothetical protein
MEKGALHLVRRREAACRDLQKEGRRSRQEDNGKRKRSE